MPDLNEYDIIYNDKSRTYELWRFNGEGQMGLEIARHTKQLMIQFMLATLADPEKWIRMLEDE